MAPETQPSIPDEDHKQRNRRTVHAAGFYGLILCGLLAFIGLTACTAVVWRQQKKTAAANNKLMFALAEITIERNRAPEAKEDALRQRDRAGDFYLMTKRTINRYYDLFNDETLMDERVADSLLKLVLK